MMTAFPDEKALWKSITQGDHLAFRVLYETYADMLYAYGLRYFSDSATVKDCIHDLFIDLHLYHRRLAEDVNIRFYLLRSFRRKLHHAFRQQARHHTGFANSFTLVSTDDIEKRLIADEQQQETLRALAREMERLPARQKEVLYLKYNCELEYEDIARLMKISVPTCRTLAYRAVKLLRNKLGPVPAPLLISMIGASHLLR